MNNTKFIQGRKEKREYSKNGIHENKQMKISNENGKWFEWNKINNKIQEKLPHMGKDSKTDITIKLASNYDKQGTANGHEKIKTNK